MKKFIAPVFFCVAFVLIAAVPAYARGSSKKASPPPEVHAPIISSVSADSITITTDNKPKTVAINQFTLITVNGKKATAADLKPGMTAEVVLGTDATKASRITASDKKN